MLSRTAVYSIYALDVHVIEQKINFSHTTAPVAKTPLDDHYKYRLGSDIECE